MAKVDFNSVVKFFKIPNMLFFSLIFLFVIWVLGFKFGYETMGLVAAFYFFGIISRIPAVYSDAVKETEVISTFGMLLAIAISNWWAALFVFSGMWISNLVMPWRKAEDHWYLFFDAIVMAFAVIIFPFVFGLVRNQIITAMFWFYVVRGISYVVMAFFFRRAMWTYSAFLVFACLAIAITQAYIVLHLITGLVFDMYGITKWTFGSLPLMNPIR